MAGTEPLLGEVARLLDAVGPLSERITIVGGLVPALLLPEPPVSVGPHGGTRDIDLGLGIALSGDEAHDFRPLEPALLSLGYRPMGDEASSYRWRGGTGEAVVIEFLCGRPRGFNDRDTVLIGDRLAACVFVAAAATVDRVRCEISYDGKLMPVWVVGVGGFIVLKLDALLDRARPRDAFDVVWVLRAWPGGPAGAAATVKASAIAVDQSWLGRIGALQDAFSAPEADGSRLYAAFFESDAPARAVEAMTTVQEFLRRYELA